MGDLLHLRSRREWDEIEKLKSGHSALLEAAGLLADCLHDCAKRMPREDQARAAVALGQARRRMEDAGNPLTYSENGSDCLECGSPSGFKCGCSNG